jgi:tetratricopeptide (TPR) repeat protein
MKKGLCIAVILGWVLKAGALLQSQTPATPPQSQPSGQKQPANPPKPAESNPFPDDTNNVPVLPNATSPGSANAPSDALPPPALPGNEADPVRSPDDPAPDTSDADGFSSSTTNLERVKDPADADVQDRKGKGQKAPEHQETAAEDVNVGTYYLGNRNWKAALSRFESAVVLDPENPEVYWGMAEAQRHLGNFTAAKANYLKLLDYDPDSKHGKDAKKILKDPELANAPTVSAAKP